MLGVPSAVTLPSGTLVPRQFSGQEVASRRPGRHPRGRVLVLGGSGFSGAPVAERLAARGFALRIVDDRPHARVTAQNARADVERVAERAFFADPEAVLADCVALVLLRWRGIARAQALDDGGEFHSNVLPAGRALRAATGKAVVFASSAGALYGESACQGTGAREDATPEPVRAYGRAKLCVERLVLDGATPRAGRAVLRPANPYGPGQAADARVGVVGTFLARVARGESIHLFGSGECERDFLYVDDLADAFARALEHALAGRAGVFNLGGGAPTSLAQLLRVVERTVGRTPRVEHRPARPGDRRRVFVDVSRARDELGWSPHVDLEEGIARTWRELCPERAPTYLVPLPSASHGRVSPARLLAAPRHGAAPEAVAS